MSSALIVIDMLNDFIKEGAPLEVKRVREVNLITKIKKKIEEAIKENIPVIYCCDEHKEEDEEFLTWPKHAIVNTEGAQIVNELKIEAEGVYVIKKTRYSAFYETELEKLLKEKAIKELLLTGILTDVCVYHTAADAYFRNYKVTIIKECTCGLCEEDEKRSLEQMKRLFNAVII